MRDEADFHQRFAGLINVLLDNPQMFGYCYTQLTDVFQEQNGLYRFDRTDKLDIAKVRRAQLRPAAFETADEQSTTAAAAHPRSMGTSPDRPAVDHSALV